MSKLETISFLSIPTHRHYIYQLVIDTFNINRKSTGIKKEVNCCTLLNHKVIITFPRKKDRMQCLFGVFFMNREGMVIVLNRPFISSVTNYECNDWVLHKGRFNRLRCNMKDRIIRNYCIGEAEICRFERQVRTFCQNDVYNQDTTSK